MSVTEIGYRPFLDKLYQGELASLIGSDSPLSYTWANEAYEHPDFDIPDVIAYTVGNRTILIVEGERQHVYPIIEKANEIAERLR